MESASVALTNSVAFEISVAFSALSTASPSSTSPLKYFSINDNRRLSSGFTFSQLSTLSRDRAVIGLGFTKLMFKSSSGSLLALGSLDEFAVYGRLKSVNFGRVDSVESTTFSTTVTGNAGVSIARGTLMAKVEEVSCVGTSTWSD